MMQCLSDWAPAQGIRTIRGANIPTNPYNLPHTLIVFKIFFVLFSLPNISILSNIFCLLRIFRILVLSNMTLKIFWIVDLKIIYWRDCSHCSKTKPGAKSDLKSSGLKQSFLKWSNLVFFSGADFSSWVMCYFSVQFYSHSRQRCQGLHRKTFIGQYTLCFFACAQYTLCLFAFATSQSSHRCILCTSTVDQIHVTPLKGSNVDWKTSVDKMLPKDPVH